MKPHFLSFASVVFLSVAPGLISAQEDVALNEAKSRLACGADTIISAVSLPNGTIKVTCQKSNTNNNSNNPIDGTTLSTGATVGIAAAAVVLGFSLSGDNGVTATTSTFSD